MAENEKKPSNKETEKPSTEFKPEPPKELIVETQHSITIGSEVLNYKATTGTIVMKTEDGKPKASVFFVAYTKDGVDDVGTRPLTFSFNGGPGSSSVWMHLGLLGPRRVLMDDEGYPLPPPYKLVNNEYSVLDVTDLVFIDPVSTGYSRPAPDEDKKQFHGLEQDIEWVGDFIRLYTTRYHRWSSPKLLIGESYGTTRAAGLSGHLQDRHGMYLNGIMLVSVILNFQTARFTHGNDLPYILFLPTYTATAWYHKKLSARLQTDLRQTLDEVKEFALGEYTLALMKGDTLPAADRAALVEKLAEYTGLSAEYVERTNLRISIQRFVKELLRDQRRTVGRFDSRITGIDRDAAGETHEHDPSYATVQGVYTATLNDYLRRELEFESDLPYEILTGLYQNWDFGKHQNQFVNVGETLRAAITKNPHLKVLVANGLYDLATPYFATEYTMNHLGLEPELRDNLTMTYYEAGHMMYAHKPSLAQMKDDLSRFICSASGV